jgi:sugar phosphate isomerase/epimerase|tara:strand:- start:25027 stop:25878 length:852 start_codon:yes stop_codon:yes gene_type:complete
MNKLKTTRRRFLNMAAVASGAGLFAGLNVPALGMGSRLENIGIQLYTVRDLMAKSVSDTLAALVALGYKEVEFAGYYDHRPAEIRTMLSGLGLSSPSTHVQLTDIRDSLNQTMDSAAEIGHDYVVLAYLMPNERKSIDDYKSYIELFSKAGEAAKQRGLQFGYHNHHFEFEDMEGMKPYDLMLQQIDSELMKMTMDLYWIHRAGQDPFYYFDKYPGRFKQCHVKDMNKDGGMEDVGAGTIDFAKIFAQREKAGFEHYYVEHDMPLNSLQTAENSIDYLKTLTF